MMKGIDIPPKAVVSLDGIARDVFGLRVMIVNVFAIKSATGWVLIDAGLRGSAGRIRRWARRHFGNAPPDAMLLTHGHFDHIGASRRLLETWRVPVYVHREELPYVTGSAAYPPPDPSVGGGLMARMSGVFPRDPIDLGSALRELPPLRRASGARVVFRTPVVRATSRARPGNHSTLHERVD